MALPWFDYSLVLLVGSDLLLVFARNELVKLIPQILVSKLWTILVPFEFGSPF